LVRRAKDVAAGGVLLAACAAAASGLFIFLPKLALLLGSE
jgi:diacylglycerol kinase